jgi:membrane protein insertase Oxa1/YidC/SpoIIIJ
MGFNRNFSFLLLAFIFAFLCRPDPALAVEGLIAGFYSPFIALSRGLSWSAEPLLNLLNAFNQVAGDYSLSLVLLAFSVTLFVLPYHLTVARNVTRARRMYPKLREIEQLYGAVILRDKSISEIQFRALRENGINPFIGYLGLPFRLFAFFTLLCALSSPKEWGEAAFFGWATSIALPDKYFIFPSAIFVLTFWRQNAEGMQTGIVIPILNALVYAGLPVGLGIYSVTRVILILSVSGVSARFWPEEREQKNANARFNTIVDVLRLRRH